MTRAGPKQKHMRRKWKQVPLLDTLGTEEVCVHLEVDMRFIDSMTGGVLQR